MEKVLKHYGVTHRLSTAYHPQTSGQVENSNRGIKRILEKTVGNSRIDWSDKLDDALWAFRAAYWTPIGTTPFRLIYGKTCHLPVELEHRAYWALRAVNLGLPAAGKKRFLEIHELEELRDEAYEKSWAYKERTKELHDKHLKQVKEFKCGEKVFPYGTIEVENEDGKRFKVNGHHLKHFIEGPAEEREEEVLDVPLRTYVTPKSALKRKGVKYTHSGCVSSNRERDGSGESAKSACMREQKFIILP
ncbi:uncharacterized protein LOC118487421 [Helianthus annuus]|uniref:uncharacterized protein LOC118487421 n=1 Tax=Helianthus annuus TaxID=4232 RepID=UPI001652BB93|nr:uncharacterized protein LOC118487421 [Helianthus annuus]